MGQGKVCGKSSLRDLDSNLNSLIYKLFDIEQVS